MTKEELIDCLGTIAQSGTSKFLNALKVVVSTKSPRSDKQYIWEAAAESPSYVIREENDPEKILRRGTQITLYLKNKDVTKAIQKVSTAYDCKIVEGVLGHQLKQFVIDGNKVGLSVSNPDTRVDDAEFEENDVYAIDIVTSTVESPSCWMKGKQQSIKEL